MYLVIMTLLVITVIAAAAIIMWCNGPADDVVIQLETDLTIIKEVMINDGHLHRLLMIEILHDKSEDSRSTIATFNEMEMGMNLLGKSLVRSLGQVIAQRVGVLMQNRNQILQEYYQAMQQVVCKNGICILEPMDHQPQSKEIKSNEMNSLSELEPVDTVDTFDMTPSQPNPPDVRSHPGGIPSLLDVTTVTIQKLEVLEREITDTIAAAFHLRDASQPTPYKRPVVHHERLFQLLSMYDKELLNQAKLYVSHQYHRSLNCAQGTFDIATKISQEFNSIIRESQTRMNQTPGRIFDSITP